MVFCQFLNSIREEIGLEKRDYDKIGDDSALIDQVKGSYQEKVEACLNIDVKQDRQKAIRGLEKELEAHLKEKYADYSLEEDAAFKALSSKCVDKIIYSVMRNEILHKKKRIGGRKLDEVRDITTEISNLKKVHGSSLFTRGETQVMAAVTIGSKEGEQLVDQLNGTFYSRFYLHYTFAPYCVGEARGYRGVGRREIGHGNLAERALKKVMPSREEFPYTVRVACEVLESNGSSSMGSVCSGSMALMDAGVKLKSPVAGVAMGLIKEDEDFVILTDILGDEDHLGDMDFKVAGTKDGITAIQMDNKISGIDERILKQALSQAKDGRLHILNEMDKTISTFRDEFKDGVPRIVSTKIDPSKIGALIGPGGKNIKNDSRKL